MFLLVLVLVPLGALRCKGIQFKSASSRNSWLIGQCSIRRHGWLDWFVTGPCQHHLLTPDLASGDGVLAPLMSVASSS